MKSLEEAEAVDGGGKAAGNSIRFLMLGNFLINMIFAGPLDQIWSIMNSLQVVMFIRLFNIKSPGNVNNFTEYFDETTSVQLFDTEEFINSLMYVPEMDPFALNF